MQVLEIALSCLSISLLSALFSPPSHCHFPGLSPGLLQQLPNYSLCIQSFSPVIQFALSFKTSKTPESHLPAVDPSKVSTDCRIKSGLLIRLYDLTLDSWISLPAPLSSYTRLLILKCPLLPACLPTFLKSDYRVTVILTGEKILYCLVQRQKPNSKRQENA